MSTARWRLPFGRLVFGLWFGLVTLMSLAADGPAPARLPPYANPEFPSFDNLLWMRQREGLIAKLAIQRLAQAPEDPDTIDALAERQRPDDALRVLRAIVEKHPDRMARAFEIVAVHSHRLLEDRARGYAGVLREITAAARTRLPQLPREQAASIALPLVSVEAALTRQRRQSQHR